MLIMLPLPPGLLLDPLVLDLGALVIHVIAANQAAGINLIVLAVFPEPVRALLDDGPHPVERIFVGTPFFL